MKDSTKEYCAKYKKALKALEKAKKDLSLAQRVYETAKMDYIFHRNNFLQEAEKECSWQKAEASLERLANEISCLTADLFNPEVWKNGQS